MHRPSCRLGLLVLLVVSLSLSAQVFHSNPQWPTDDEFLLVNRAVDDARQHYPNVEEPLVWALIWEESKYDPLAVGLKGEVGLGQLMPGTASALGVRDRTDITGSVQASVRHLSYLLKKYKNNTRLVLAAYNSGEPAVDRCRCVPAASRAYVNRIEQNRLFAKRIVEYLHNTLLPSATQQARVTQLERQLADLQAANSTTTDPSVSKELAQTQTALQNAQADADVLRVERDRLQVELQRDNSLGAQCACHDGEPSEAPGRYRKAGWGSGARPQPNTEASAELEGIRTEIAELKSAIQIRNVQDTETQQRLSKLSLAVSQLSDKAVPLIPPSKKSSARVPLIAVIAASSQVEPDPNLSGALQDALLRRGLPVNVELETREFLSRNLDSLLAGRGGCLRKVKAKKGSNWDYVIVLRTTGKPTPNDITDTSAYAETADSRLYTAKGNLLAMQSFSETGAGFSESQARESASLRLGQVIGEYVRFAVPH